MVHKKDVLSQLSRILNSSQIINSVVLTDFLTFVVTETLDGRAENLKEYTIGIHALKRDHDFNPQLDSIVRIHAGRLRRALKEYYYEDGKEDPIVISIPKGSYAPTFKFRTDEILFIPPFVDNSSGLAESVILNKPNATDHVLPSHFGVRNKVTLTVAPFKNIGSESEVRFFANGLGKYLSTELTHFQNIKIVTYPVKDNVSSPLSHAYTYLGDMADFILSGSVQWLRGHIRIWVQVNSINGEQLWAQTFERAIAGDNYYEFQEEIVDQVLAALMGLNGAISRYQKNKVDNTQPEPGFQYPIDYWFHQHTENFNLETIIQAKSFYLEILKREPNNALAYAYLSQICTDQRFIQPENFENEIAEGFLFAHKSIKSDSHCQEGYLALAFNLLLQNNYAESVRTLEQGYLINQKAIEYKGAMGAALISMGHYERGKEVLDAAFKITPYLPWWQLLAYCYYSFHREHYQDTLFWLERIEMDSEQISIIKAASYAYLDEFDKGVKTLLKLESNESLQKILNIERLNNLFTPPALALKIQTGLRKLVQHTSAGVLAAR